MTNKEARELAISAGDILTPAEASAIQKLMAVLRNKEARVFVAESLCEVYGWYGEADPEYLDFTGSVLVECDRIARDAE